MLRGLPWWLRWQRIYPQCRTPGFDPRVGNIPWKRKRLSTPVFWPGEFHELHSTWGCKELDMTEWLSLSLFTFVFEKQFCWVSSRMTVILSQHFGVMYYFTVSWFSWLKRLMSFSFRFLCGWFKNFSLFLLEIQCGFLFTFPSWDIVCFPLSLSDWGALTDRCEVQFWSVFTRAIFKG